MDGIRRRMEEPKNNRLAVVGGSAPGAERRDEVPVVHLAIMIS
jgi:hypothetical protein